MKRLTFFLLIALINCVYITGQTLTLNDLTNLCSKTNWEDVNQALLLKKWVFYDSEKGSTERYNTISWSYKKDYYSDKAQGWISLYTYEGYPNMISYTVHNAESYSLIYNSLSAAGYKLLSSEIEDNEVTSTYSSKYYTLEISTQKKKIDDFDETSLTAYKITLIKKAGIYDTENGRKSDYYDDGSLKVEYTLLNGEINGTFKVYYENGALKKVGNYINGKENGIFKEYDEYGSLSAEISMLDGVKNGVVKVYEDGKISYLKTLKDDTLNGLYIDYFYNDETGKLEFKNVGNYVDDKKDGCWKLIFIDKNSSESVLTFKNYIEDLKNGNFQDVKGDSLIIGNYKNDLLNGEYKIYIDLNRMLVGGIIDTKPSNLILITEGNYYNDIETGNWKYYDLTRALTGEGKFVNGEKSGEWKSYYSSCTDGNGNSLPYSKELFLVQNYLNGKLNGKSTRFSYLDEEKYLCAEIDPNKSPLDTCERYVYQKILETSFYKNGKLNGPYELRDSLNKIIVNGYFKDDFKDGEWLHRYMDDDNKEKPYFIYQKGNYTKDKREGKWIEYYAEQTIAKTFNYKSGFLHGEYIVWNQYNRPIEKKQFNNGKLIELLTYDSLGLKPLNKYVIIDGVYNSYKCKRTQYLDNGYSEQEYWVKKDKDIDQDWFELSFLVAINPEISGGKTGYKDGEFKLFNYENQPVVTGAYLKEDRIGLWMFYYYDQNVKIESDFTQGKCTSEKYLNLNGELFSGKFIYNDFVNGIKEERKISNGLRNGKTIYIDTKTNKTIKKESYKKGELK